VTIRPGGGGGDLDGEADLAVGRVDRHQPLAGEEEDVADAVDRRRDRFQFGEAGEDRAIADLAIDDERRALGDLECVKFRRARPGASFDFRRTRALEQLRLVEAAGLCADFRGEIPIVRALSFALGRIRQRHPDAVVCHAKIARGFRYQIRRQTFLQVRLEPAGLEHERRSHHHSAPAIKPFRLLYRFRKARRIHQSDLPLEIGLAGVALLQFLPRRLRPETPGRNHIEINGDFEFHRSASAWMVNLLVMTKGTSNVPPSTSNAQ